MAKRKPKLNRSESTKSFEMPPTNIVVQFRQISLEAAAAIDARALLKKLLGRSVELLGVIQFWRLEGATHIKPRRAAAMNARWQVEWKENELSHGLLDVSRISNRNGVHIDPVLALTGEDLLYATSAIGLLDDAVGHIYRCVPFEDRLKFGITTVDSDVCEQLRHAIELLGFILKPPKQTRSKTGRRKKDETKRKLIADALDAGKDGPKEIQTYVSEKRGTTERVSRKMILEVKKLRQEQRQK
jgi:hypothetical protein